MDHLDAVSLIWAEAIWRATWQGAALVAVVWCLVRIAGGVPATVRSWLWRLVYVKLLVALLWAWPVSLAWLPSSVAPSVRVAKGSAGPSSNTVQAPLVPQPSAAPASSQIPLPSLTTCLMAAWLIGVGWTVTRAARGIRAARRVLDLSLPVTGLRILTLYGRVGRAYGVRRIPRLLTVDGEGSPLLMGLVRPAIIVPEQLLTNSTEDELRMVLAHELAHSARRDLWWSWLAVAVNGLMFFHPLVWLANRHGLLAQEMACDEMALQATHAPVGDYGELLVKVAIQQPLIPQPGLATVAVDEPLDSLKLRLDAMGAYSLDRRPTAAWAALIALIAVIGVMPWRLVAQPSPEALPRPENQARSQPPNASAIPSASQAPQTSEPPVEVSAPPATPNRQTASSDGPDLSSGATAELDPETRQTLADLRSADHFTRHRAVSRLADSPPNRFRTQIAAAIAPLLEDADLFIRQAAVQAMALWSAEECVPLLIKRLADKEFSVRWVTLETLGKLKDARAATAVAAHLVTSQDRFKASPALQSMGPAAESAVHPYLQHADWSVRLECCHILKAIGTQASLTALQPLTNDQNGIVVMAANEAISAIQTRE